MSGPAFFQTVMGHRFYEGDVPRIAKALERIADGLGELAAGTDGDQAMAADYDDEVEAADSAHDVRRGLKRGAELVRAFGDQVVPGVSLHQQRQVLDAVAALLETYAETYGEER